MDANYKIVLLVDKTKNAWNAPSKVEEVLQSQKVWEWTKSRLEKAGFEVFCVEPDNLIQKMKKISNGKPVALVRGEDWLIDVEHLKRMFEVLEENLDDAVYPEIRTEHLPPFVISPEALEYLSSNRLKYQWGNEILNALLADPARFRVQVVNPTYLKPWYRFNFSILRKRDVQFARGILKKGIQPEPKAVVKAIIKDYKLYYFSPFFVKIKILSKLQKMDFKKFEFIMEALLKKDDVINIEILGEPDPLDHPDIGKFLQLSGQVANIFVMETAKLEHVKKFLKLLKPNHHIILNYLKLPVDSSLESFLLRLPNSYPRIDVSLPSDMDGLEETFQKLSVALKQRPDQYIILKGNETPFTRFPCWPLFRVLHIDCDGSVHPCLKISSSGTYFDENLKCFEAMEDLRKKHWKGKWDFEPCKTCSLWKEFDF